MERTVFTNRAPRINVKFAVRAITLTFIILLVLGSFTNISYAAPPTEPRGQGETVTPYQGALADALSQRRAAGLPVPSVTYDLQGSIGNGRGGLAAAAQAQGTAGQTFIVTATTIINFDGPEQAGYDRWPDLIIEGNLPTGAEGSVAEGDYTEIYRTTMEEQLPGIWDLYEFGYEPRRHTITETFVFTYPDETALSDTQSERGSLSTTQALTSEQILMGFTYTGPKLDYSIGDSAEVCVPVLGCATLYKFKAGFDLDWALGLRLPASATLSGPDQMVQGNNYNFSSTLNSADWSGSQYSSYGVAAESGNEFVLRLNFFAGVQAELLGVNLCPGCSVNVNEDASASFATPFGTGSSFPIPPANIPKTRNAIANLELLSSRMGTLLLGLLFLLWTGSFLVVPESTQGSIAPV